MWWFSRTSLLPYIVLYRVYWVSGWRSEGECDNSWKKAKETIGKFVVSPRKHYAHIMLCSLYRRSCVLYLTWNTGGLNDTVHIKLTFCGFELTISGKVFTNWANFNGFEGKRCAEVDLLCCSVCLSLNPLVLVYMLAFCIYIKEKSSDCDCQTRQLCS